MLHRMKILVEKHLLAIVLMLANGIVAEACFEAERAAGLSMIRGLVQGPELFGRTDLASYLAEFN
jgi:hypothetical protein